MSISNGRYRDTDTGKPKPNGMWQVVMKHLNRYRVFKLDGKININAQKDKRRV